MKRTHQINIHQIIGAAGLIGLALALAPFAGPLRGQETIDDEYADIGVPHAECSFFTAKREQILKVGLDANLLAMSQRSELTAGVVAALPKSLPFRSRAAVNSAYASGSIDDRVFSRLNAEGVSPAPPATDTAFLRRVTVDLTGRIPTAQEVIQFVADPSADKRARAIDRLLATPQWADRWAMFFGDLLRNTVVTAQVNRYPDGRDAFHLYLRDSMRANKPYDQMAREILSSGGANDGRYYPEEFDSYQQFVDLTEDYEGNPVTPTPSSYIVGGLTRGGPLHDTWDAMANNVARDFLGISQMDCILCHDGDGHLDSISVWGGQAKRLEAWQLASFFAQTVLTRPRRIPQPPDGERRARARWWVVRDSSEILDRRGQPLELQYTLNTTTGNRPSRQPDDAGGATTVAPVYPFGGATPKGGESRREAVGRALTEDIQFSRAIVNYIWREFFGRGIVEPPDQFDLGRLDPDNPPPDPWEIQPSHPRLLQNLAESFVANGYDLQWLMRDITNSRAYQLSSRYDGEWNAGYEPLLARHQVRRLDAEAIHDALVTSSGIFQPYFVSRSLGPIIFAKQFPDVQFLPRAPRRQRDRPSDEANFTFAAFGLLEAYLRGDREQTPRSSEATIIQALHQMNSPLVLERVKASRQDGILATVLNESDAAVVTILYLQVLSRYPTPDELAAGLALLVSGDRTQQAEDLMWSLYNSVESIFNY